MIIAWPLLDRRRTPHSVFVAEDHVLVVRLGHPSGYSPRLKRDEVGASFAGVDILLSIGTRPDIWLRCGAIACDVASTEASLGLEGAPVIEAYGGRDDDIGSDECEKPLD